MLKDPVLHSKEAGHSFKMSVTLQNPKYLILLFCFKESLALALLEGFSSPVFAHQSISGASNGETDIQVQ